MDLEGIVAKRADSLYVAGRSDLCVKVKTAAAEQRAGVCRRDASPCQPVARYSEQVEVLAEVVGLL